MIIESTSPLKRFRTKNEEAFNMVIPLEKTLGKGAFGIVYGPFTAEQMRNLLFQLYRPVPGAVPGCRCDWDGVCPACLASMEMATGIRFKRNKQQKKQSQKQSVIDMDVLIPEGASYVFKADFHSRTLEQCPKLEAFHNMPAVYKRHFIVPLVCGVTSFARFEVQRYGGTDLFHELTTGKTWERKERFLSVVDSVIGIVEGCFWLIEHSGILVTDIKPENMTYDPVTGKLSLIDIEYAFLHQLNRRVVYTSDQMYVPVQFFNHVFFPVKKNRDQRRQRFLENAKRETPFVVKQSLGPDEMVRISKFCIVWVMTNVLMLVVEYTFPQMKHLKKMVHDWVAHLRHHRWKTEVVLVVDEMKNLKKILVDAAAFAQFDTPKESKIKL